MCDSLRGGLLVRLSGGSSAHFDALWRQLISFGTRTINLHHLNR
jgi:hypothetical protein